MVSTWPGAMAVIDITIMMTFSIFQDTVDASITSVEKTAPQETEEEKLAKSKDHAHMHSAVQVLNTVPHYG